MIPKLKNVLVGRNSGRNNANLCCQNPDHSRPLGLIPRCMIFVLTSKVQVLGRNGERLGDLDQRKAEKHIDQLI